MAARRFRPLVFAYKLFCYGLGTLVLAFIAVQLWFLTQVLRGAAEVLVPTSAGGIAWWAHIGGFLAGFVLTPVLRRPRQRYRPHYADEGILGFGPTGR